MGKILISIGDSDKYAVDYAGNSGEFEKSPEYREIVSKVIDFLNEKFPSGGFDSVLEFKVEDCGDSNGAEPLTENNWEALLKDVARQVEVIRRTNEQNLNAPYDQD